MKVLHLSTSDMGGAGRAAYRLHQGLRELGVDSQMLVRSKICPDKNVLVESGFLPKMNARLKLTEHLDSLPLKLYKSRDYEGFSLQWVPSHTVQRVAECNPDVINLHWVSHAFLSLEEIAKLNKPLVWTLHDMWAFTGGCHYNQGCEGYLSNCGNCSQLHSQHDWDLSHWVWQRKSKAWQTLDLTIVTPSHWLAECAKASSLFKNRRIEVIPNALDTRIYHPGNRSFARECLNLPLNKKLILFGAMDSTSNPRKGFHLLQSTLQKLGGTEGQNEMELVVFGASRPDREPDFGLKTHYVGSLGDDISLALLYAAADVFVAPSMQDNLPNTVMESLACGTPAVAFGIGGMPDLIDHEQTGYLARPFDTDDLAKGIIWTLENQARHQKMCCSARNKAETAFSLEVQAKRYGTLFRQLSPAANFCSSNIPVLV